MFPGPACFTQVPHQFRGAIALAWYRNPRATADIDVNVTLSPEEWDAYYLDVFFATLDLREPA